MATTLYFPAHEQRQFPPPMLGKLIFGSVDRVVSRLLGDVDSVVVLPRTHEDAILAAAQEIDMQSRKP